MMSRIPRMFIAYAAFLLIDFLKVHTIGGDTGFKSGFEIVVLSFILVWMLEKRDLS
jgi:hypothetical protein